MIVRWKPWLRGCLQKQKSRGLLISSTRYGAFDPFWGPKTGRFWPPALVERGEGGGISAMKWGNGVISSTGNARSILVITASILVETNVWLLLEVLFPALSWGRSRGWGDPSLVKRRQPDRNQTTIRLNVMISSTE